MCASVDVEHPEVWYEIGYCYDQLERLEDSVAAYDQQIDVDPYAQNAWYNRGIVLNRLERFDRGCRIV